MEYTGKIFLKTLVRGGNYYGWNSGGEIKVEADSLNEALRKIEQEGLKKFPESFIHIDSVSDFVKKEVYRTGWDELGPLVAVNLESVKKEIEESEVQGLERELKSGELEKRKKYLVLRSKPGESIIMDIGL